MTPASYKTNVRRAIVIFVTLGLLISFIATWNDLEVGWNGEAPGNFREIVHNNN